MKHAKKRLAEMREQNTAISESVIKDDSPPEIHTILISENEQPVETNHLSVPKSKESSPIQSPFKRSSRRSRDGSTCSIRSTELDNDTMVCILNEIDARELGEHTLWKLFAHTYIAEKLFSPLVTL